MLGTSPEKFVWFIVSNIETTTFSRSESIIKTEEVDNMLAGV